MYPGHKYPTPRDDIARQAFLVMLDERHNMKADTAQEICERLARCAYIAADALLDYATKPSGYKPKE